MECICVCDCQQFVALLLFIACHFLASQDKNSIRQVVPLLFIGVLVVVVVVLDRRREMPTTARSEGLLGESTARDSR